MAFSDPEIATAGMTLAAAQAAGADARAAREGFLQVVSATADGCVLGVRIAAPHTSDLIGEGVLAIEMGATAEDLALTVHAHPTFGEMFGEATHPALGQPLHVAASRWGKG